MDQVLENYDMNDKSKQTNGRFNVVIYLMTSLLVFRLGKYIVTSLFRSVHICGR